MADLTYQDVQRATQDAVRGVQGDLQRLTNDVANISRQAQFIDDLQRSVQELNNNSQRSDPSDQVVYQIQRDIQELKVRFEAVEKFCREMADYFRARNEAGHEDQEYRSVTPAG